jgi:inosine/xanthosine triphosphate pyrophosphatase family protein
MTRAEKAALSHRGRALRDISAVLGKVLRERADN